MPCSGCLALHGVNPNLKKKYQYKWRLWTTLLMKKGIHQKLLQELVYIHVLDVVESVPVNIESCWVQTSNVSTWTVLWAFSMEFLKFYDIPLFLSSRPISLKILLEIHIRALYHKFLSWTYHSDDSTLLFMRYLSQVCKNQSLVIYSDLKKAIYILKNRCKVGIYPSSFTNIYFWTRLSFGVLWKLVGGLKVL